MVVCKCRKATKLYCFVHKVPVCGECICFSEHQICVVNSYSEWVIDGEYDWPPNCPRCQAGLEGTNIQTTRLGCLHVMHTDCLISHIQGLSQPLLRDECICPVCSTQIWPPKSIKDPSSSLHLKLKEAIVQSGVEKILFGDDQIPGKTHIRGPPPAFDSTPLVHTSNVEDRDDITSSARFLMANGSNTNQEYISSNGPSASRHSVTDIIEVEDTPPNSSGPPSVSNHDSNFLKNTISTPPGATTRKTGAHLESQNSEIYYYADDEDGNRKKYSRRGPFRHKFLRALLPFWSTALPTLPVTTPHPRKNGEDARPHQRPSRVDPRKVLLFIAIMACMTTMGILYYRIVQRGAIQIGVETMATDEQ